MNKWLNKIELKSENLKLEPLDLTHVAGLTNAVKDGELFESVVYIGTRTAKSEKLYRQSN